MTYWYTAELTFLLRDWLMLVVPVELLIGLVDHEDVNLLIVDERSILYPAHDP